MGCSASVPAGVVTTERDTSDESLVSPVSGPSSDIVSVQGSLSTPYEAYDVVQNSQGSGQEAKGPGWGRVLRSLDITYSKLRKMHSLSAGGSFQPVRSSFDVSALPSSLMAKQKTSVEHAEYQHSRRRQQRSSLDQIRSALTSPSMVSESSRGIGQERSLLCPAAGVHLPLPEVLHELECNTNKTIRPQIRFLKYKALLGCQKLLAYEYLKQATHVSLPYDDVTEEMWDATAVVSWRWHRRRPTQVDSSFSPMSHVQLSELKRILAKEQGIKYIWIDFACIPQKHSAHCMAEVMRSRLYFYKARRMIALPAMVVLPHKNNIWPMLKGAIRAIDRVRGRGDFGAHKLESVIEVRCTLKEMLAVALLSKRDYFSRAWSLAERMARAPRGERLEHWMPLRLWISTVADLLWVASNGEEDRDVTSFPWDMLDATHGSAMLATLQEVQSLCKAKGTELWIDSETESHIAHLFLHAFEAWQSPLAIQDYGQAWLRKYMQEQALQRFSATLLEDTLWAVYGFYRHDQREFSDLAGGVQALCTDLGIDPASTQWFNMELLEFKAQDAIRRGSSRTFVPDTLSAALPTRLAASKEFASARGTAQDKDLQRGFDRAKSMTISVHSGQPRNLEDTLMHLQTISSQRHIADTPAVICSTLDFVELQQQMRCFRNEMSVQLAACRAVTQLVRDRKTLKLAESVGLMQDVYAVVAHHNRDRGALEQALLALYTLTRSSVISHNVACTACCLVAALQAALKSVRDEADSVRIEELCCACLSNVTLYPDGAFEALALMLVEDIGEVMRSHHSVARMQEHCCGIVQNVTSLKSGTPVEKERFLEALGHSHLMLEVRNAMEEHISQLPVQLKALAAVLNMTCQPCNQEKAARLGILEAIQNTMAEHISSAAVQQLACDAITNINLFEQNLGISNQLVLLQNVQIAMRHHSANQKVIDSACEAAWLLTSNAGIQQQGRELSLVVDLQKAIAMHSASVTIQREACAAIENILQI